MARVNDKQSLCHGVNSRVIINISGNQYLRSLLDRFFHHAFAGTTADSHPCHKDSLFAASSFILLQPVAPDCLQSELLPHEICGLPQRHGFRQVSDSSNSFQNAVVFTGNIQHTGILQLQNFPVQPRHAKHIKIGVHGVAADVIFNQGQDSSAIYRIVCHLADAAEQQRMMGNQHIRAPLHGLAYGSLVCVQRDKDLFYHTVSPSHLKPRIVPFLRALQRIILFQPVNNFITSHSDSARPPAAASPFPVPPPCGGRNLYCVFSVLPESVR